MPRYPFIPRIHPLWWFVAILSGAVHVGAQSPDGGEDIRGPKELIEIPVPEKPPYELWLGIGGAVLLVIIAWFIWKHFKKRQVAKSPRELALAALAELEVNREFLMAEAFADRAAQTVRQYIADRFGIAAPRRTTEEFLRELATEENSPLAGDGDQLRVFLKSCDLAKFAGSGLNLDKRGELVETARAFIRSTSNSNTP